MQFISQDAINAALSHFHANRDLMQTQQSSAWEAFLTGRLLDTQGTPLPTTTAATNAAVTALFTLSPDDSKGRLKPFRYDWGSPKQTGRATVWNVTTRGRDTYAASLFNNGSIKEGIRTDALSVLLQTVPHRPAKEPLSILLARDQEFPDGAGWPEVHQYAQELLGLDAAEYDELTEQDDLGVTPLGGSKWAFTAIPAHLRPSETSTLHAPTHKPASKNAPTGAHGLGHVDMEIEARTERMLRRAVERFPFILLVGPPGTGKSTLVDWITEQVTNDPESFGFPEGFAPDPIWRTPDESWSAFDIIGGLAPDESGALRWSPGALLNAVEENRWLVLDETNRADMDKIMGPLFTWLSGQQVEVGRDLPHGGDPVILGWDRDDTSPTEESTYLAGGSWRLFGTYNPADAQRVFRMGQALSRRFVVIPIPALDPSSMQALLESRFPDLDADIRDDIGAIYAAHHDDDHTQLGPAVYLRMAEYIEGGDEEASTVELLAEAYVTNLGKYVASFDDAVLDGLEHRILESEALTEEQWTWIKNQRHTLG